MLPSPRIANTRIRFWIRGHEIDQWARRTNLFFVLAIGRSGTEFLARLLAQVPEAIVVHEPVREDFDAYQRAFHDPQKAARYIQSFRKKEIYLRARSDRHTTYGEVNSVLRRHADALKVAFPDANFIHLVRDGRDVVRSMMARKTMTTEDRYTVGIWPHADDPWEASWEGMDRFERLCWYWQVENRYLRSRIDNIVQFERLLAEYEYLCKELLEPCGLDLPRDAWARAVDRPQNVTMRHKLPHWSAWESERSEAFKRICRDEMSQCGYEL